MVKYYCDWCGDSIEDDELLTDRIVDMVADFGGEPYFSLYESKKKRDKFLLCNKCLKKIITLKQEIKEHPHCHD